MKVTIVERAAGHFQIRMEIGKAADGTRTFKYETVRGSRDDAERRRFTILQGHEDGTFAVPDKVTLGAFFEHWIKTRLAMKKIRRTTAENYRQMFNLYVAPKLAGKRLQSVSGQDVQGIYVAMATEVPEKREVLSDSTLRHMHRILSSLFKAARRAKITKTNCMEEVEAPMQAKVKPKALDEQTAFKLLQTLAGDWKEPITILAFSAGLRRGEVLGLRWRDIDLTTGRLSVAGQLIEYQNHSIEWVQPKTEKSLRTITLPPETVGLLRSLRRDAAALRMRLGLGGGLDDAFVFTRGDGTLPIKPSKLTREFSVHCDANGLPDFTFHGTRHTHATALLRAVGKAGAKAVSERLGHADLITTLSIYQTVFEGDDAHLAALTSGLLSGRGKGTK